MAPLSFLLLLIWICTSAILTVSAEFVNVTIDDYYRDALFEYFIYSPSGAWTAGNATCTTGCDGALDLPAGEVTYNTWHQTNVTKDPTVTPSEVKATVTFTGSSVYVFGVLASTSSTQLRFRLNGTALSDNFTFSAQPGPTTYSYNQLLYANESLPEATHHLDILNGDVEGGASSLLVIDYLVYTRNTDIDPLPSSLTQTQTQTQPQPTFTPTSPQSQASTRTNLYIILPVAIVGPLLLAAICGFSIWYWKRWRSARTPPSAEYMRAADAGSSRPVSVGVRFGPVSAVSSDAIRSTTTTPVGGGVAHDPMRVHADSPFGVDEVHR